MVRRYRITSYNVCYTKLLRKAFFISGFDSSPLAPDYDFVLSGKEVAFQAGIDVIKKLTDNIHIGIDADASSKVYKSLKGVKLHSFQGKHPAGNVGVQIHQVAPINKGEVVWVMNPQEVVALGKLFKDGVYDASRVIALTGSEVEKAAYFHTKVGAQIKPLVQGKVKDGNLRNNFV